MNIDKYRTSHLATCAFGLVLAVSPAAIFAQNDSNSSTQTNQTRSTSTQSSTNTQGSTSSTAAGTGARERTISSGEKAKIVGVVTKREADTFTISDINGVDTVVRLTDTTRVTERKSNPFRRARNYATTNILPGLSLEVEGRGDATGQLTADKVRFSDTEFKVARSLEARVNPVENRVGTAEGRIGTAEGRIGQVEQNAQRLSGQLEELAAVSNAAKGGAVTAQATADAAVTGVRATNDRISALDDYSPQQTAAVNFKVGSAVLSRDARTQLDEIAKQAFNAKGYVIEVSGFASADGSLNLNRRLSERRADAVVRYLAENHRIPLRRIVTPFGYGESQAVADNTTREGRARNRRVEVKVLVNRGLTQPAPEINVPSTSASTNTSTGTPTDTQSS
ncbi:MAG: OmpA family protein, partial [Pyrinomonadaceae bacterium]|nr:OmpA family protein [Pyrinomonadaceae bacterium]